MRNESVRQIEVMCKPQGNTINMIEFTDMFLSKKGRLTQRYSDMCINSDITLFHYVVDMDTNNIEIIFPEPGDTKEETALAIIDVIHEFIGEPFGSPKGLVDCLTRNVVGNVTANGYILSFAPTE